MSSSCAHSSADIDPCHFLNDPHRIDTLSLVDRRTAKMKKRRRCPISLPSFVTSDWFSRAIAPPKTSDLSSWCFRIKSLSLPFLCSSYTWSRSGEGL